MIDGNVCRFAGEPLGVVAKRGRYHATIDNDDRDFVTAFVKHETPRVKWIEHLVVCGFEKPAIANHG